MMVQLRILLLSVLAAFVSAGLIGCAVFSAPAGQGHAAHAAPAKMDMDAPGIHQGHDHHAGMDMAGHDGLPSGHSDCEGCAHSLLNRAAMQVDTGILQQDLPAPTLALPAALVFAAGAEIPRRAIWPPGDEPPIRTSTLTHQKISLLI